MFELLSLVSDLIQVGSAVGAAALASMALTQSKRTRSEIFLEQQRQKQWIHVELVSNGQRRTLPISMRRKELSRAELLGRIGMVPMRVPGARFALSYLSTPNFLDQLDAVQQSQQMATIVIPCNEVEFHQFA